MPDMAGVVSDSPLSQAPLGKTQRTPSAAHTQQKRNNRNRKSNNHNNTNQFDGAVSDGAVAMPIPSPQSKKAQRQQSMNMGAPLVQHSSAGTQKSRPVSVGAGLQPDTPGKSFEQAYAGATFSNSPAPSSLPVPKFFGSKSVPNVARPPSAHSRLGSANLQSELQSSPDSDVASPVAAPEPPQSPLDLFFKADRKEKESRNLSQSLSPNVARASPFSGAGKSYQQSGKSGKSIFLSELDGDDTNMPSPRTIPTGGRPTVGDRAFSSPQVPVRASESEEERLANTKSLKELLFNTAATAMTPPQSRSGRNSGSLTPEGVFGPPSPINGSGPATPQPSSEQQNHYSLHYGNRNLSPLFKASRTETPPRPSSLRQELPSDANSAFGLQTPPYTSSVDTFARTYLKDQIRAHAPAEMPQLPFNSGPKPTNPSGNMPGNRAMPYPVQPVQAQHGIPPSGASPRAGSRDVQTMENDLRRMLKLNV